MSFLSVTDFIYIGMFYYIYHLLTKKSMSLQNKVLNHNTELY